MSISAQQISTVESLRAAGIAAGGMKLSKWCKAIGMSRTTAWRLRKSGDLPVVVRYSTAYVTAETIKNFFRDDGSVTRTPKLLSDKRSSPLSDNHKTSE